MGLGYSNSFEIFNLNSLDSVCKPIANYPNSTEGSLGFVGLDNRPVICGGWAQSQTLKSCNLYTGSTWKPAPSLKTGRIHSGVGNFFYYNKITVLGGYSSMCLFHIRFLKIIFRLLLAYYSKCLTM